MIHTSYARNRRMSLHHARPALTLLAALVVLSGCANASRKGSLEEGRAAASTVSAPAQNAGAGGSSSNLPPRTRDMEASVNALLNGYERVPTAEDWKRLGPTAYTVLDRLIASPDTLPSVKSRAISSLVHVQNPEALPRLEGLVKDAALAPPLRATAVLALAARGGQPTQTTLAPLLQNPDARVREAAARALGRLASPTAREALELRLADEKDTAVRQAIEAGLSQTKP